MLIKGNALTRRQRQMVLAAFVYRWTSDNRQRTGSWANIDGKPTIPLVTDQTWLDAHAFHFVADGSRLHACRNRAEPAYLAD